MRPQKRDLQYLPTPRRYSLVVVIWERAAAAMMADRYHGKTATHRLGVSGRLLTHNDRPTNRLIEWVCEDAHASTAGGTGYTYHWSMFMNVLEYQDIYVPGAVWATINTLAIPNSELMWTEQHWRRHHHHHHHHHLHRHSSLWTAIIAPPPALKKRPRYINI